MWEQNYMFQHYYTINKDTEDLYIICVQSSNPQYIINATATLNLHLILSKGGKGNAGFMQH